MAGTSYNRARDHIATAEQLEKAAQCHREAARLFESGNTAKGAEQAQMAQSFEKRRNNTETPPRPTSNRTVNRAEGETIGPLLRGGSRRR
jgi:hypothetical protein